MSGPVPVPAYFLYGEPPRPPDAGTVHVETIAARSRLHDWKIKAHRHRDLHQLLIVHRGRLQCRLDGANSSLLAPALVVVPPGTVHAFEFEEHTAGEVVSFASGLARELSAHADGLLELLQAPTAVAARKSLYQATDVAPLGEMLLREFARSAPGRETVLRGLLGALLGNLLRLTERPRRVGADAAALDQALVARFREAIEQRYRSHLGIAEYARELGVTEARLRRACSAATGEPPTALVHLRMLVEAERQLRYTAMPVTQIAYYLGFEDPAYFTRFFTRGAGASPRAFRRRDAP